MTSVVFNYLFLSMTMSLMCYFLIILLSKGRSRRMTGRTTTTTTEGGPESPQRAVLQAVISTMERARNKEMVVLSEVVERLHRSLIVLFRAVCLIAMAGT